MGPMQLNNDLIDTIEVKTHIENPYIVDSFDKIWEYEKRIGDDCKRWYIKDNILSYLNISHKEAQNMASQK